jgi:hypothetical protein
MSDEVEVYLERIRSTDEAILFTDGDNEIWLPKFVIIDSERIQRGRNYKVTIPFWVARQKEII